MKHGVEDTETSVDEIEEDVKLLPEARFVCPLTGKVMVDPVMTRVRMLRLFPCFVLILDSVSWCLLFLWQNPILTQWSILSFKFFRSRVFLPLFNSLY